MQFALATALAAAVLAVAAPALNPHHVGLAERSHAAAMLSGSEPATDLLDDGASPPAVSSPGQ